MALTTIAAALAALALQQLPTGGSVRGEIRSEETGAVVAGATVEVLDGRPLRATASDSIGRYVLADVPAGRRTIRARRVGFAPLEMEVVVPGGREVEVDIALRMTPVVLAPVTVGGRGRTAASDTTAAPSGELTMAGVRAMQSSPGLAEIGLADAIAGIPGEDPPDPSDVLYVRGTGADLKLVYLDGAPVYAPFPLGGLLDPFTPGLLSSAEVYLGGAPARYDGGLSYILDLRTRGARGGRVRSSGAADLLSARALVEVPLTSGVGLLLSGRGVHDGRSWLAEGGLPYGYREGLARLDMSLGRLGVVSVTGFGNGERVWLDSLHTANRAIEWGNASGSIRYSSAIGASSLEVTAALGEFSARLPVAAASASLAEGFSRRMRLSADLSSRLGGVALRYGASFEEQRQEYRARPAGGGAWRPVGSVGEAAEGGVYLDAGVALAPRVHLRGGLRADHFSLTDEMLLAPRLATTLMLTDRAALTLAAGRYHQYLRPPEVQVFGAGSDAPIVPAEPLALARATHVSLTFDQEVGDGVRFGLEGFFKNFQGVPGGLSSEANASGMDLWVRRATGEWRGWLGYSLAWNWTVAGDGGSNRFAGRHLLSSGLSAPLGDLARLDLGFVYGAGLPYAAIPFGTSNLTNSPLADAPAYRTFSQAEAVNAGNGPLLSTPSRPYLRVDVGASGTWSPRWGGAALEISPYVRLLNTLGQRDALFYRAPEDEGGRFRPVMVLPVVPVVGMEWKF